MSIFYALLSLIFFGMMTGVSWSQEIDTERAPDGNGQIATPKIYTIYSISMDERASTSSRASREALRKAQRLGLEKLFRKIIREEDHEKLPQLIDGQVSDLVNGIEIANEKSSPGRYIADFTVHFSRDKIYNFLSVLEIPFAETLSKPVSLLAVYEQDGAIVLWEKNNPWREAWLSYDTVNNLVPIQIIEPSLAHRMAISAWQAQQGNQDLLQKFADQKDVRKLYVMSAVIDRDLASGRVVLDLTIFKNDDDLPGFKTTVLAEPGNKDQTVLFDEAIKQATYWLDNRWKEKVMIHFGISSHLKVKIKFDRSEDWFEIKKKLESISLIRKIIYKNFTTAAAEVEIEHSGDVEQIILTLDQENLLLTEQIESLEMTGDYLWVLTLKK